MKKDYSYYYYLVKCIREDKLVKPYSELEPYKDNLKLLFSMEYDIELTLKLYYEDYQEYIDKCILFVKKLGNTKININTLNIIRKNQNILITAERILDLLICLYTPELAIGDFPVFLNNIDDLFMYGDRYWLNNTISTGYPLMDEVFKYFKKLKLSNNFDFDLYIHDQNGLIIITIIAALNYYKDNDNLNSFTYYMDHFDDVLDKLEMNDIYEKHIHSWSDKKLKYIFDNFETILGKKNKLIK